MISVNGINITTSDEKGVNKGDWLTCSLNACPANILLIEAYINKKINKQEIRSEIHSLLIFEGIITSLNEFLWRYFKVANKIKEILLAISILHMAQTGTVN